MTVEEYLDTSYHPDREFVDGQVIERNLGLRTHSSMQGELLAIEVFLSVRVQVSSTRIRVPDLTVIKTPQLREIFTAPPHLCIEVPSGEDTVDYVQEKIDDYLHFGVPYIWIVNLLLRKGYVVTKAGMVEAKSGVLETSDLSQRNRQQVQLWRTHSCVPRFTLV